MKHTACHDNFRKLLLTPYFLISAMSIIVLLVLGLSIWKLYTIGFEQQKKRLEETVQSRARLIEVMAEYKQGDEMYEDMIEKNILDKIILAHERFEGFGQSGEFTMAKLDKEKIHFLLAHRHDGIKAMKEIDIQGPLAEPMQHALKGESGTLVGLDYRGAKVLAAYEPISSLGWGIVAKIDLSEIQKPYKTAIIFSVLGAVFLIVVGSGVFLRVTRLLLEDIERERQYNRMLFNETSLGLALCTMDGKLMDVNPAYADLIGLSVEETLQRSYWDITPKSYRLEEEKMLNSLLKTGKYGPYDKEYIHKDGHLVPVRLNGSILKKEEKEYIWSIAEDIGAQKRKDEALREASLVFEHTREGIIITDSENKIIRINSSFTRLTGFTFEEVKGKDPKILQSGSQDKEFYEEMWESILEKGTWYGEIWNKRKDGELFPALQSITEVKDEKGVLQAYVAVFSDISTLKEYEEKLKKLANHDTLTSLPNRLYFNHNLEQAIYTAKQNGHNLAVLFIDLNDFKVVNDGFGHNVGDQFLQSVATRFASCVRENDLVARLGGDEFVVVLNGLEHSDNAIEIVEKIMNRLSAPLVISEHTFAPSASIGISIYPEHADSAEGLLQAADRAMYKSKSSGKNHYTLFNVECHA